MPTAKLIQIDTVLNAVEYLKEHDFALTAVEKPPGLENAQWFIAKYCRQDRIIPDTCFEQVCSESAIRIHVPSNEALIYFAKGVQAGHRDDLLSMPDELDFSRGH